VAHPTVLALDKFDEGVLQKVLYVSSISLLGLALEVVLHFGQFLVLLAIMFFHPLLDLAGVQFSYLLGLCKVLGLMELLSLDGILQGYLIILDLNLAIELLPVGPLVESFYSSLNVLLV
jgi:hypothetical protein